MAPPLRSHGPLLRGALLLATGARAVLLRLAPYYRGPHARAIDAEAAALTDRIAQGAGS